jgi:ABC-type uncharacterized transport system substrate-binding protein
MNRKARQRPTGGRDERPRFAAFAAFAAFAIAVCLALPPRARGEPPAAPLGVAARFAARALPVTPVNKPGGGKWRIGYFESGKYGDYPRHFEAVVEGLRTLGWLTLPEEIPEDLSGEAMWRFLAQNARSDYLEFAADAFWSDDFDENRRAAMRAAVDRRLREKRDVDLMLALGSWAGQDMAAIGTPAPTIVVSASDAVAAGIVPSAGDSGQDNLNARVTPGYFRRQIRLFRDAVPFERLGLIYENTPEGRSYAAFDEVEAEARASGFQVVPCEVPFSRVPLEEMERNALSCYAWLAKRADAIYVTTHRGTDKTIQQVAALLRQAKIPSFSMRESKEVEAGILMGMAQVDYSYIGLFHAETMARIFHGAKPRQLPQIWDDPVKIALNLKTARLIGFDPPIDVLLAAVVVFGLDESVVGDQGPEKPARN